MITKKMRHMKQVICIVKIVQNKPSMGRCDNEPGLIHVLLGTMRWVWVWRKWRRINFFSDMEMAIGSLKMRSSEMEVEQRRFVERKMSLQYMGLGEGA